MVDSARRVRHIINGVMRCNQRIYLLNRRYLLLGVALALCYYLLLHLLLLLRGLEVRGEATEHGRLLARFV